MHRPYVGRAAIACLATLALLPLGCAAPAPESDAAATAQPSYPDWIRLVPEETDEATFYVGTVALARDVEEALDAAAADAFSQMREDQRRYFVDVFDRAAKDANIETTPQERLELRTNIADEITDVLRPAVERVDSFYRLCEGEDGQELETVCEAFVLVRLDHTERDRIAAEALAAIGRRKQEAGETNLAALIEWALRNQ